VQQGCHCSVAVLKVLKEKQTIEKEGCWEECFLRVVIMCSVPFKKKASLVRINCSRRLSSLAHTQWEVFCTWPAIHKLICMPSHFPLIEKVRGG